MTAGPRSTRTHSSSLRILDMTRPSAALLAHRADILRIVATNCAANARVFGSVLHGDDSEENDLDILVDALP